jgi:predicted flap endonuclease-1-like 5' DNA nuclease
MHTERDTAESLNISLEIQDVEGIGPTTAKKLKDVGIISVMELPSNWR